MSNNRGCQCGEAHGACTTEFQYAVKIVCGGASLETPNAPVAPGQYYTAINLHNPDKCKDAHFRFKIAVALQSLPNPVSQYFPPQQTFVLGPDAAAEIDCPFIRAIVQTLYPPPQSMPRFIKGFLVIETDIELDVVAVYTGAQTAAGLLTTFQTERVQPRCVPVCEDLVLPLHTGIAAWQTVLPTPGALGPVVPAAPSSPPPVPFGSSWVSQFSTDWQPATTAGVRHYEMSFDLCSGYGNPAAFQIQVLTDDSATIFLNGPPALGTVPLAVLTSLNVPTNKLRSGRNRFRVEVTNTGGTTGFALAGILRVPRGKCPCAPSSIAPIALLPGQPTVNLFGSGLASMAD